MRCQAQIFMGVPIEKSSSKINWIVFEGVLLWWENGEIGQMELVMFDGCNELFDVFVYAGIDKKVTGVI